MSEAARALERELDHDDIVVLRGVSWADYQRVLEIRGERPVPRLTFLEGALELMSPSRSHETITSAIGRLVEAWCMEVGVEITPCGSWTLEQKDASSGAEPDECYVLGDVEEPERPDLAIEVVWTSGGLNKLDVCKKLGVREVWYWRKSQGLIEIFALRGPAYEPIASSEVLAGIDHELLARFIQVRPMTRAVRAFVRALRETPAER